MTARKFPPNVIALDAHIDTTRYVARWGHTPHGRSELWLVIDRKQTGFAQWYKGSYSRLVRRLTREFVGGAPRWILYGVTQALTDDPKHFIKQL